MENFNKEAFDVRIPVATSIAAGSGKLNFKERVCWGTRSQTNFLGLLISMPN
ncbi:hypothetical protein CsSME_00002723 [Camellia sinensis var. sinensis]